MPLHSAVIPGSTNVKARIDRDYVKSQALRWLTVSRDPRRPTRALLRAGGLVFPAAIGRSGFSVRKREGDGATPVADLRLLYGYYRPDRLRLPPTRLAMRPIQADHGWCDAPHHPAYNRLVRLPFAHSHERMMRDDGLYDICLVLDWNVHTRRRHHGSAIFFHLTDPHHPPTEGCIAVRRQVMLRLLPQLGRETVVRIV